MRAPWIMVVVRILVVFFMVVVRGYCCDGGVMVPMWYSLATTSPLLLSYDVGSAM